MESYVYSNLHIACGLYSAVPAIDGVCMPTPISISLLVFCFNHRFRRCYCNNHFCTQTHGLKQKLQLNLKCTDFMRKYAFCCRECGTFRSFSFSSCCSLTLYFTFTIDWIGVYFLCFILFSSLRLHLSVRSCSFYFMLAIWQLICTHANARAAHIQNHSCSICRINGIIVKYLQGNTE